MPLYEYIAEDPENGCRICIRGFELRRSLDREPLEFCLLCKKPVRKVISQVSTPKVSKEMSVSAAKSAGFTILKKRDVGVYEKL